MRHLRHLRPCSEARVLDAGYFPAHTRGPRKGEWPLWGEEKSRYSRNFLLAENVALYLVL